MAKKRLGGLSCTRHWWAAPEPCNDRCVPCVGTAPNLQLGKKCPSWTGRDEQSPSRLIPSSQPRLFYINKSTNAFRGASGQPSPMLRSQQQPDMSSPSPANPCPHPSDSMLTLPLAGIPGANLLGTYPLAILSKTRQLTSFEVAGKPDDLSEASGWTQKFGSALG